MRREMKKKEETKEAKKSEGKNIGKGLNIGMFCEVYKPVVNGVVYSIDASKRGLEKQGHNVYVFTTGQRGYKDVEPNVYRCPYIPLKAKYGVGLPIFFGRKANAILKKLDIVHCHHPYVIGKFGATVAKKNNIPLVFTSHSQYDEFSYHIPFNQKITKTFIRWSVRNFANKCDAVIAPASKVKQILVEKYKIKASIKIIPNAIDLDLFRKLNPYLVRRKYNLEGKTVLMYAGRLSKEKNLQFLLRVFQIISRKNKNTVLILVGDGPEKKRLANLVKKLRIRPRVIFTGFVGNEWLPQYYAAADIFTMASKAEVHPLTIMEAMAAGTPVVAINAGGAADIITNNQDGLLIKDELFEFAMKVDELIKNRKLRKKLSLHGLKTVRNYSIPKVAEQLEELYRSLIKK